MQDFDIYRKSTAKRTLSRQQATSAMNDLISEFHENKMMYDNASVYFVYNVSNYILDLLQKRHIFSTAYLAEQIGETDELFSAHSRYDPSPDEISEHLAALVVILLKSAAIDLRLPELAFCVDEVRTSFRDWVKAYFNLEPDVHYAPVSNSIEALSGIPINDIQSAIYTWNNFLEQLTETLREYFPSFNQDVFKKHNFSVEIVTREPLRLSETYVRPIKRVRLKLQNLTGRERFPYERERLQQRLQELEKQAAQLRAEGH